MTAMTAPAHLALTEFFIEQNPLQVVLERAEKVSTGTGGFVRGAVEIVGVLTGRLVASSRIGEGVAYTSFNGSVVTATHKLILMPDLDVQIHDTFAVDDVLHEVIGIATSPPWRLQAEVYRHGG